MSDILRQQESPLLVFDLPSRPTSTEIQIVKVAERELQVNILETTIKRLQEEKDPALQLLKEYLNSEILAIQKEIADRLNTFSMERQKAEAAVSAQVADLEAQIHTLKQENSRDASR